MASVEDGIAAQIRNIEARYGRPLSEWFGLIAASSLTKHAEVVAMLKSLRSKRSSRPRFRAVWKVRRRFPGRP